MKHCYFTMPTIVAIEGSTEKAKNAQLRVMHKFNVGLAILLSDAISK
jgi:hypothetical protein